MEPTPIPVEENENEVALVAEEQDPKLPESLEPEWPLGKLYDAYRAVSDLEKGCKKLKIPFALAWQIDDLVELFKPHALKFERRQQELLSKFGKQIKDPKLGPNQFSYELVNPEDYQQASRELSLSTPDFDPNKIKPISCEALQKVENLEVSLDAIRVLRYLGLVKD